MYADEQKPLGKSQKVKKRVELRKREEIHEKGYIVQ